MPYNGILFLLPSLLIMFIGTCMYTRTADIFIEGYLPAMKLVGPHFIEASGQMLRSTSWGRYWRQQEISNSQSSKLCFSEDEVQRMLLKVAIKSAHYTQRCHYMERDLFHESNAQQLSPANVSTYGTVPPFRDPNFFWSQKLADHPTQRKRFRLKSVGLNNVLRQGKVLLLL